jgi:hypothetical protein
MAALRGGREVTAPTRMVLGGYIMLALLTVFLTIVIARLGVLDGPAIWLADWLTANIDGADLSVAAGFSLSLLAYLRHYVANAPRR